MELREYQQKLIDDIKLELTNGSKSILAVLSCGGGKSIIQAMIAKGATDKGNRVLFLVHRKELCEQIRDTFRRCRVDMNLCTVAMVQTISKKITKISKPQLIITDEAHHCYSNSYIKIYDYFSGIIKLGFTATPIRMNEGGLGKIFDKLITSVTTKWLVENNFLSPYEYYSVRLIDTENIHVKRGEYDAREVAELVENNFFYGETLTNYEKLANGKKTIIYCATVEQSKQTIQEFKDKGYKAEHIDGTTPKGERARLVEKFRNNQISILSNVDLFGEGFDIPDCECVILLRPTKSLTLFIQQSMRSMRYKADKTAIIIDHVGNVYEHGLPDDEREWTLKPKKQKEKEIVKIKECEKCYKVISSSSTVCKYCGHVFLKIINEKKEKETVDLELERITRDEILAAKPYAYVDEIGTFDDLVKFQKAKKYQFGWVLRQCLQKGIFIPPKYDYTLKKMGLKT
ncbi:MAG: DEAD/DEAH box helicase [Clostridia bacterium]